MCCAALHFVCCAALSWTGPPTPLLFSTGRRDWFPTPVHHSTMQSDEFPAPVHHCMGRRDRCPSPTLHNTTQDVLSNFGPSQGRKGLENSANLRRQMAQKHVKIMVIQN